MGKKNQGKRKVEAKEEDENDQVNGSDQQDSGSIQNSYNDSDDDEEHVIDYAPRKNDKKISKSRGKLKNGKSFKKFSKKQEIEDSLENQKEQSIKKSKRSKEMSDVKSEESSESEEQMGNLQEGESSSISDDQDDEQEENDKISSISSEGSSQNQVKKQDNPVKSERDNNLNRRLQLNYQMVQNGGENTIRSNLNYDTLLQLPQLINRLILETVEIKKSLNQVKSAVIQKNSLPQTSSPTIESTTPIIKREKIEIFSEQKVEKRPQSQKQTTWKTDTKSSEPEKSEKKAKKMRRSEKAEGSRIVIE